MTTHLQGETTFLTSLWRITRADGTNFFFTDHDVDVTFEGDLYESSVGYNRTAVSNQVGLSVDNLDVSGFLDSSALTDTELRAGLFDFADVRISIVNFVDLANGAIKIRKGKLGEIVYNDSGFFQTELRGLTQAYSQQIVELYEPECRADLGDARCKVTLFADVVLRTTTYAVGDAVRTSALLEGVPDATLLVPGDVDEDDVSGNNAIGTLGTEAVQQTAVSIVGAGALEFTPTASDDPSQAFVSYPDIAAYTIGANDFTIEAHVRLKNLVTPSSNPNLHTIASQSINTSNNRAWIFRIDTTANNISMFFSDDGTSVSPAMSVAGNFTWVADTNYHVACTRDASNDVRLFVDGVQVGSTTPVTFAIHNSSSPLWLGKNISAGFGDQPLDGFIDDFRFVNGFAVYTAGFTPPAVPHPVGPAALISGLVTTDFDDVFYTCTVAGLTAGVQPAYDPVVSNTTVDGTATFTAVESFVRAGTVSLVTDNRIFSLTFDHGGDTREVADWFKYGALKWDTGNNIGLAMEVKQNEPSNTTGITTLAVDDTNTISRAAGSFATDGFVAGMSITTTGFTDVANNGSFTVQTVNALTLDIVETTLVAEVGTGDEVIVSDERLTLFLSMPFPIQVGDTFSVYAGCDKRLTTCIDKFANVTNFRGEPYVPGQDAFLAIETSR